MWFCKYFQHHPPLKSIGVCWIITYICIYIYMYVYIYIYTYIYIYIHIYTWIYHERYMTRVLLCRWREVWKHDEAGTHQVGSSWAHQIWHLLTPRPPRTPCRGLPLASWDLRQSPAHCNWHGSQCELKSYFFKLHHRYKESVFWWRFRWSLVTQKSQLLDLKVCFLLESLETCWPT